MTSTSRPARRRPTRRRRPLPIVLAAALLALVAAGGVALSGAAASPTVPRSALRINVAATPVGRPVPLNDIGLSIEYQSALQYFGHDPAHPDPVFAALVRALDPRGTPILRFGGDTTDWTWWDTPGVARPGGIRFTIGPAWARSVAAMASFADARLIFGINFEADSRAIARTEAVGLLRSAGRRLIAAFELGNEPEVYGSLGWYASPTGRSVLGRPPAYDFSAYLPDYAAVLRGLPRGVAIAGPASGSPAWLAGLPVYLRRDPRVRIVTFHRYPLHRCFTSRTSPDFPSIRNLLAPVASSGPATSLAGAVAAAHAVGRPLRVDELNSVSCGGARGVSDTFAAALWVVDTLFHMAGVGVDGVNIHTFQKAVYEPFAISHRHGRWAAQVRPLYDGLLFFTRAAPAGSRLLPARVVPGPTTRSAHRPPALGQLLRIWATAGPDRRVRVVLINDSAHRSALVAIRAPARGQEATVQRLAAPRLTARRGITLGGQSFGASTSTGVLAGRPRVMTVAAIQGRFVVRIAPASATLLTVTGSRVG